MNIALYVKWTLAHVREKGFFSAIGRMAEVAWQRIFQGEIIIFCFELNHIDFDAVPLPPHITVERKKRMADISPDDMLRLASVTNERVLSREMEDHFKRGSDLWLAKIDGTIATYRWSLRKTPPGHSFFPFSDNDVYMWQLWTYKEYRGRNIPYHMGHYVLGELKKEGVERAFWTVDRWNKPSLRYTAKMPAYEFGRAKALHILGRDIVIWYDMHNRRRVQRQAKAGHRPRDAADSSVLQRGLQ